MTTDSTPTGAVPPPLPSGSGRGVCLGDVRFDDLSADHSPPGIHVDVAGTAAYTDVEALARTADRGEVFEPVSARLLAWFTHDNPHGEGFLVAARAPRDGPVVGHFLFYAQTLLVGAATRAVPAMLYVNLYVAPAVRRRGVFAAMFGFGQAAVRRLGVPFSYTVPNQRSSPGFAKFGVRRLGTLPCWMAPASALWRAWPTLMAWGGAGVEVDRVEAFALEMLPEAPPASHVRGRRTIDDLAWRFGRRPGVEYAHWVITRSGRALGYAVTRVMTIQRYRVLAVCDLQLAAYDAAVLRRVIASIAAQSADARAELVMFQGGAPGAAARLACWRAGLVHVPDWLLPQPVAVYGGAPGLTHDTAGLPGLTEWHLTPGDWDVF